MAFTPLIFVDPAERCEPAEDENISRGSGLL
jgi:hypothetical protein